MLKPGIRAAPPTLPKRLLLTLLAVCMMLVGGMGAPVMFAQGSLTLREHGVMEIPYPSIEVGRGAQKKWLEKGEYLAKVGDCIVCHTDTRNQGPAFAGGLAIDTPFGQVYSTNITADPETGIGRWSDDDFIRAMRRGRGPNGEHYWPVFPYTSYTVVADEDLLAIKAYLFAVPRVQRAARAHRLRFPYNIRGLMAAWKLFFFEDKRFQPDVNVPEKINRGAYLVHGLGRCVECHSPRNSFGALKKDYALTGGFVEGYYAPDLSTYGLGDSPIDEHIAQNTDARRLRSASYQEPALHAVDHQSLQHLTPYDREAIAQYLKRYQAKKYQRVAHRVADKITTLEAKKIYQGYCSTCHKAGLVGAPTLNAMEHWRKRLASEGLAQLVVHAQNGYNAMPPKGACSRCTDAEIEATVAYMLDISLAGDVTPDVRHAPVAAKPRRLSLADGKKIYELNCAVCHAPGHLNAPVVGDKKAWRERITQNMDVLFAHTIEGFQGHPARGACVQCSNHDLIAAVKYMVNASSDEVNVELW